MKLHTSRGLSSTLRRSLDDPRAYALIPPFALAAFWSGSEAAMFSAAVALPLMLAILSTLNRRSPILISERDVQTGLILRDGLIDWADAAIPQARRANRQLAVICIVIDDLDALEERFGRSMRDTVLREAASRLHGFLRDDDVMARISPGFAIGLRNVRPPETEMLLQLARRLQSVFEEPFSDGPTRTYCSVSLGIAAECHVKGGGGANVVAGAQRACELASVSGAGSVRVYSDGLSASRAHERDIARELSSALDTGEISAWFQPQVRTDTGEVTGFEALARWDHPDRGLVSPNSFLSDLEKAGLSQRLAEVILKQSLIALNAWDAAGYRVPTVSVNFSSEELRNPRLPDYVRWELDRHELAPERLVIEVLESVVADSSEDVIPRTLTALSQTGCLIDLDDFGTGFTRLINIRRFNVSRIKIDRSLVSRADRDPDQRRMLSALLAFSEKLGISALAEGVETEAEVKALNGLGCAEIQGYVAARPMPLGETLLWLDEHALGPQVDLVPVLRRSSNVP